jgi:hypothetical protein
MESHQKGYCWSWSVFLLSEYWLSLYLRRLLEIFFFFLFFPFFLLFSMLCLLRTWFFFSNSLTWNDMVMTTDVPTVDAYSWMELCTPIWLNHDYGDGELWIYPQWMYISKWRYARQYFWLWLANKFFLGSKSFFFKKFKTQMDTSLNKAQRRQELLCG